MKEVRLKKSIYYFISFILNSGKCNLIYGEGKYISGCLGKWAWKAAGGIDYKKP